MVACPNGAVRAAGKPKYVRVSESDIERWYPGAGALFYLWMRPFVGRLYDIDAIAALNPDVPTTASWVDFIADAVHVWGITGVSNLTPIAEAQIVYWLFLENCVCNGVTGTWCTVLTQPMTFDPNPSNSALGPNSYYGAPVDMNTFPTNQHRWRLTSSVIAPRTCHFEMYSDTLPETFGPYAGYWYAGASLDIGADADTRMGHWYFVIRDDAQNIGWLQGQPFTAYYRNLPSEPSCTPNQTTPPPLPAPSYANMPAYTPPSGSTADTVVAATDALQAQIAALTTLSRTIQRQVANVAPTLGTPVAVTGDGEIAVQNILGCLVQVTSVPPGWGKGTGADPRRLPSTLDVRFGDANGAERDVGVRHEHQLVWGAHPTTTRILYTARPFVEATITPILSGA